MTQKNLHDDTKQVQYSLDVHEPWSMWLQHLAITHFNTTVLTFFVGFDQ